MDGWEFTTAMASAFGWPAVLLLMVMMFRRDLRSLLGRLKSAKIAGQEFDFFEAQLQRAAKIASRIEAGKPDAGSASVHQRIPVENPEYAQRPENKLVLQSWSEVQRFLDDALRREALPQNQPMWDLLRELEAGKDAALLTAVSPGQAQRYRQLATYAIGVLDYSPSGSTNESQMRTSV